MTHDQPSIDEATRIRDAYARQRHRWQQTQYRGWMPGSLFMAQEQERVMPDLLRHHGAFPLADKRILDVGCGARKPLLRFLQYGAQPPRTEAAERLLTLPLYGAMSDADVDHVVEGLLELQS